MPNPPKKPTQDQHEAMSLYASILEEAKVRIKAVEDALSGKVQLPGPLLQEFCFLQLRFLCELIALGCLVIHGDIRGPNSKKAAKDGELRKKWSADDIIKALEVLHPPFYPIAHSQERTETGFHLKALKEGYLTKEELLDLYQLCGRRLHRGSLKNLLKQRQPIQFSFPEVLGWLKKIGTLLSFHFIPLFEPDTLILVVLRNLNNHERVQVAFATKNEEASDDIAGLHRDAGNDD